MSTLTIGKLVRVVLVAALVLAAVFALPYYMALPARSFCAGLTETATPASVLALARAKGLPAFDHVDSRGAVSVLSRRSPYFRYACEVHFEQGRMVSREVIAAD